MSDLVRALRSYPGAVKKGRVYRVLERSRDEYGEPIISLEDTGAESGFAADGFERVKEITNE